MPTKRKKIPAVMAKCPACFGKSFAGSVNMQCTDPDCLAEFSVDIDRLPVSGVLELDPAVTHDIDHNSMHQYFRDELFFTKDMLAIIDKIKNRYKLKSRKEAFQMMFFSMDKFLEILDGSMSKTPYVALVSSDSENPINVTVNAPPNLCGGRFFDAVRVDLTPNEMAGMLIDNSNRIIRLANLLKFYDRLGVDVKSEANKHAK